jgi:putative membrane protein
VTARILVIAAAAFGLALACYVVRYVGLDAVLEAVSKVGVRGFMLLCLYSLMVFLPIGFAWYVLMPDMPLRKAKLFIWARMVRDAAAEVLPFSQFGGMALGVRAAMLDGLPGPTAVGSMIVDVTTELLAQIAYIVLGVLILFARVSDPQARSHTGMLIIGIVLISIGGGIFVALQRYGHHWVARKLAPRVFPGAMAATTAVAQVLDEVYRSRARIGLSLTLHFCGWVTSATGTWIAFRLMGSQVDLASVIAIESLVYAARSAGSFVPNALGVQEFAYAFLAPLFGVHPDLGVGLSMLRRALNFAIGVPILVVWQLLEGQRAFAGKPTRDH